MKPPVRDAWEAFLIYFFPTLENWNDFIIFAQKPKIMDNKAIPDNVFRYNLGKDVTKIETPLKVYNMATQQAKVVNAVWDTGATCSAVSRRIVKELELTEDGVSAKIGIGAHVLEQLRYALLSLATADTLPLWMRTSLMITPALPTSLWGWMSLHLEISGFLWRAAVW